MLKNISQYSKISQIKNNKYENISINQNNFQNSIFTNNNKLYNSIEGKQQQRVRSVVRISRRSSEPQIVGSKPIGPVIHRSSNNSLCILREGRQNFCLLI